MIKLLKKLGAGLLLSLGFLCLMITFSELIDQDTTLTEKQEASDTAIGGIAFGVPFAAAGGWILWDLYRKGKKELSDRLQSTFYELVKQGNGQITVLNFAIESQLSPESAKQYLDQKAKELDATFNTDEQGRIFYEFNL